MNRLKNEFVCLICQKIQIKSTRLPCKCISVCRSHLNENKCIACVVCGQCFNIDEHVFEENEMIKYNLDHQEMELKITIENLVQNVLSYIDVFKESMIQFSLVQFEHFLSVKNEIDIKRELLLQDVYKRVVKESDREKIVNEILKVKFYCIKSRENPLKIQFFKKSELKVVS
jgi:hypothetical protein